MNLHMLPLYFWFNLRRFIFRRKFQERNPGVDRVTHAYYICGAVRNSLSKKTRTIWIYILQNY
jgi:hypothetical protein